MIIYAALTHRDEPQHHFHRDHHRHGWVYYVVLQKYGFIVCVISFFFFLTCYKFCIYFSCINTHRQTIAPFNINHFYSSSDCHTRGRYQVSANHYWGYRNSDVIHLLQPFLTIHYCNQSVLAIVPDLNIVVWSINSLSCFKKWPGTLLIY